MLTLQENGWEQIVLSGGMFRTPSDALVGPFADRTIRTLNADVLFLGVHGVVDVIPVPFERGPDREVLYGNVRRAMRGELRPVPKTAAERRWPR